MIKSFLTFISLLIVIVVGIHMTADFATKLYIHHRQFKIANYVKTNNCSKVNYTPSWKILNFEGNVEEYQGFTTYYCPVVGTVDIADNEVQPQ